MVSCRKAEIANWETVNLNNICTKKRERVYTVGSSINPILTLDYIIIEDENKIFERKSAQLKPSDIADEISA